MDIYVDVYSSKAFCPVFLGPKYEWMMESLEVGRKEKNLRLHPEQISPYFVFHIGSLSIMELPAFKR